MRREAHYEKNPIRYLATISRDTKSKYQLSIFAGEKAQYQISDNPIFQVFYLEALHGVIANFSGNLPYEL
ncbi:MAG: hypothetical protein HFG20_09770 [Anaerotruncus sp.]|nr:hypothetical protein [Anaerotruncus sp.]